MGATEDTKKGVCAIKKCKHFWETPAPAGWVMLMINVAVGDGTIVQEQVTICPEHWMPIFDSLIISDSE